jgi:hypothetical protein
LKFFQINLHHSKVATATLCQQLAEGKADVAFMQESLKYRGQIGYLINALERVCSVTPESNARSCIYVRIHINTLPLLEFCSRDATTVRITYIYGGGCEELIVASAYLPYDSDEPPPTKEVRDAIDYYYSWKKQLIIGCDANAHHILWWNTGTNPRGGSLMEFLMSSNLNVLKHGNEPTFVVVLS